MRTMISMRGLALHALIALAGVTLASPAFAAPVFCGGANTICYDDWMGSSVMWTGIQETVLSADDAPATALDGLYQAPIGNASGTSLLFDPSSFEAQSTSGTPAIDVTHSLLNATIMSAPSAAPLDSITISESGDYSFVGFGGSSATGISGTISGQIIILESTAFGTTPTVFDIDNIDGVLSVSTGGSTIPGGHFDTFDAAGPGAVNWTIDYFLDLSGLGVTKAEIQLDNILSASSEPTTSSLIQKKVSLFVVPEPGTAVLVSLGLVGLAVRRRLRV